MGLENVIYEDINPEAFAIEQEINTEIKATEFD